MDLEVRRSIDAIDAFVIDLESFTLDEGMQATIAEAWPFAGVRRQAREQLGVDRIWLAFVPPRRRAQPDEPTRAPETRALRSQSPHRLAPRDGAYHFFATTAFSA